MAPEIGTTLSDHGANGSAPVAALTANVDGSGGSAPVAALTAYIAAVSSSSMARAALRDELCFAPTAATVLMRIANAFLISSTSEDDEGLNVVRTTCSPNVAICKRKQKTLPLFHSAQFRTGVAPWLAFFFKLLQLNFCN